MQVRPMTLIAIYALFLVSAVQNLEMRWELSTLRNHVLAQANLILDLANASKTNSDSIGKLAIAMNGDSQALLHEDRTIRSLMRSVRALDRRQENLWRAFPPNQPTYFAPFPKKVYAVSCRW